LQAATAGNKQAAEREYKLTNELRKAKSDIEELRNENGHLQKLVD